MAPCLFTLMPGCLAGLEDALRQRDETGTGKRREGQAVSVHSPCSRQCREGMQFSRDCCRVVRAVPGLRSFAVQHLVLLSLRLLVCLLPHQWQAPHEDPLCDALPQPGFTCVETHVAQGAPAPAHTPAASPAQRPQHHGCPRRTGSRDSPSGMDAGSDLAWPAGCAPLGAGCHLRAPA